MDDHSRSGASNLSLDDLMMKECSSRPPQISEWFWCIEYAAKFSTDLRSLLVLMEIGYDCTDDFGDRINEVIAFRLLELLFDPSNSNANEVGAASTSEPRVEFDFSSSNADVLLAILKEIPASELCIGMVGLSKFNVLPFLAHKRTCMPQYALEKVRDFSLMESKTRTSPSMEANQLVHTDIGEELRDEQQVRNGLEPMPLNEVNEVICIDDEEDPIGSNEKDHVTVDACASENEENDEDVRLKCTKDGTWLISGSDNESDMINEMNQNDPDLAENDADIDGEVPSSSRSRPNNVCSKCEEEGMFFTCNGSDCASKIHKECLNSTANVDEDGNFYCPLCWYDRCTREYVEIREQLISAKRKLGKFLKFLNEINKKKRSKLGNPAAT